jgi:hypothetical protein
MLGRDDCNVHVLLLERVPELAVRSRHLTTRRPKSPLDLHTALAARIIAIDWRLTTSVPRILAVSVVISDRHLQRYHRRERLDYRQPLLPDERAAECVRQIAVDEDAWDRASRSLCSKR